MTPIQQITKRLKEAKAYTEHVEAEMLSRGYATTASPPVSEWDYVRDVKMLLGVLDSVIQLSWKHEELIEWGSPSGFCSAHQNPTLEENWDCDQCFPKS